MAVPGFRGQESAENLHGFYLGVAARAPHLQEVLLRLERQREASQREVQCRQRRQGRAVAGDAVHTRIWVALHPWHSLRPSQRQPHACSCATAQAAVGDLVVGR